MTQTAPAPRLQHDLSTPAGRAEAARYVRWSDHGVLRRHWHNFGQVAEGVYRSNHPDHGRLARYADMGISAILNLRGTAPRGPYLFEAESCAALGLDLHSLSFGARKAADRDMLQELFAAFDAIPRPFLMHCKSGADRAGLASALYLLDQGESVARAKRELSVRYLHLAFTKTGIQDHMLDMYAARLRDGPISIRDWVANEYDPDALTKSFAKTWSLPI